MMPSLTTATLTYIFLYISVVSLWLPDIKKIPWWLCFFFVAICFGVISHVLEFYACFFPLLLLLITHGVHRQNNIDVIRVLSCIGLFILGVGLSLHLYPGFHNLRVLDHVYFSSDALPFTLYLNFDKTMVGLFIIGVLHQRIQTKNAWLDLFKTVFLPACGVIVVVACLSFSFGFVRLDLKFPACFPLWACSNLLFVCLAEEGFFRGFIQKYLSALLKSKKGGDGIAIVLSAILFGLYHYQGGSTYVILATLAGIGYGWVYWKTNRIEGAMLTHFSLNTIHFLAFTYPALAPRF
jgi:membrane protease YdiL (CAAX protease family)